MGDVGLDAACAVVDDSADGEGAAPFEAWQPFELYDRTADARFAGCFGDAEAHRMRSRVVVREGARAQWEAAVEAHWEMLWLEGRHDLFAPSSTLTLEAKLAAKRARHEHAPRHAGAERPHGEAEAATRCSWQ